MPQKSVYNSGMLIIFLVAALSGLLFLLRPVWEFRGDGHGYYIYLRSLYFDHDINFLNEIERYDNLYQTDYAHLAITPLEKIGNPFAIGSSIAWVPFFLGARLMDWWVPATGGFDLNGFQAVYRLMLGFGSVVYALMGVIFLWLGLKQLFSERAAWLAAGAIIFISPLLHYIIYEPLMSHALSFAVNCVLFYYVVKVYQQEKISNGNLILIGLLVGWAVLVRWQEIWMAVLPTMVLAQKYYQKIISRRQLLIAPLVAVICFIPQMAVWKILYGSFFVVPQGDNFIQLAHLKIWPILFSGYHGLFTWHPVLLVCLLGVVMSYKKDRLIFWSLLTTLIGQIIINASLSDWWGGTAFGARKFIGTLPVFVYGLAYLLNRVEKKPVVYRILAAVLIVGGIWNILLMVSAPKGCLSLSQPQSVFLVYAAPFNMLIGNCSVK